MLSPHWPKISKRFKILSAVFGVVALLALSSITILAKTGAINIRMLADELSDTSRQRVTITIRDINNNLRAGASLEVIKKATGTIGYQGLSDKNGQWSFDLDDGVYDFSAKYDTCQVSINDQTITLGNNNFEMRLDCESTSDTDDAKATLKGRVVYKTGKVLAAGAIIMTDHGGYSVVTAADGSYNLIVDPGSYYVSAAKQSYHMVGDKAYIENTQASQTYTLPDFVLDKDTATGDSGGTSSGDSEEVVEESTDFDVLGSLVLDNYNSVALNVPVTLSCSYRSEANINFAPKLTTTSSLNFQYVGALKYNFRFEKVPKKYNGYDLDECTLSAVPDKSSILVANSKKISYSISDPMTKISYSDILGKDAAYLYKFGLQMKDGSNNLRVMGQVTDYTGTIIGGINVALSSDFNSSSAVSSDKSLDPSPFSVTKPINYQVDLSSFNNPSNALLVSFTASGYQPQTIDLAKKIEDKIYKYSFDQSYGFCLTVDIAMSKNSDIKSVEFDGSVYYKYRAAFSSNNIIGTSSEEKEYIKGASVEYTISNDALNYSVTGTTTSGGDYGIFDVNNIPISARFNTSKSIKVKVKIIKEGFRESESIEEYYYKNIVADIYIYADYQLNPEYPQDYQICLKATDSDNNPLDYAKVFVVNGDVEEYKTLGDFKADFMNRPTRDIDKESIIRKGSWALLLKDYKNLSIGTELNQDLQLSLFIIPGTDIEKYKFPLHRSYFVDSETMYKMSKDSGGGCITLKVNFESSQEPTVDYKFNFFSAETGEPFDMSGIVPKINAGSYLFGFGYSNSNNTSKYFDYPDDYKLETSASANNQIVLKLRKVLDSKGIAKIMFFRNELASGEWYYLVDGSSDITFNSGNEINLYLVDMRNKDKSFYCTTISGQLFCMLKYPTKSLMSIDTNPDNNFTEEYQTIFNKMSTVLSSVNKVAAATSVPVYIAPPPFDRASANLYNSMGYVYGIYSDYITIAFNELKMGFTRGALSGGGDTLFNILVHEYSHALDFMSGISTKDKYKFDSIVINGNTEAARKIMNDNNCCRDSQFPNFYYSSETNSLELWAEFFTWWYLHNDEFRSAIADDSKISEPCKQVLKFMYAVLQQTFPKVTPYDSITTTSEAATDSMLSLKKSEAVFAASGSKATTGDLNSIIKEAGFVPTTKLIKTESITPLTGTVFTEDQIINGTWAKSKYESALFFDKFSIQYQIMISTIKSSSTARTISNIATSAINKYNQAYDTILKKMGMYKTTGSVKGRITDKSGVGMANMIVEVDSKSALTDKDGFYKISNLQTGSAAVDSVKDLYTGEDYTISKSDTKQITASHTGTINATIVYPKISLKGKVSKKNGDPLVDAVIFLTAGTRRFSAVTDSEGNYKIDGVYNEKYKVVVYLNSKTQPLNANSRTITPQKTTEGGSEAQIDITLSK